MLKIAVINPYVTDFKLYDEWMHPLGLYFLITLLKNNGHEVYFFNTLQQSTILHHKKFSTGKFDSVEFDKPELYKNINRKYKLYGRPEKELLNFLQSIPKPDYICVGSMMTYWAPGVLKTINIIRTIYPEVSIIIGGIAAQLIPYYFMTYAKNCLLSESLFGMTEIAKCLHVSKPLHYDSSLLQALMISNSPHGALLLTLGCPLLCSYCASRSLQPSFKQRSIATVIDELKYMVIQRGITDFAFYDDALLYKPQTTLFPLLEFIKRENFKLRLHTPNGLHLKLVDEVLLLRLKEAGFRTLRFGYESSAKKYRSDTCGKVFREEVAKKIAIIIECGFKPSEIGIYIMAGLRDQTPEDVLNEMDYIGSLGINVKPVFLSPVPNTLLFKEYAQKFPEITSDPLWHNDSFFITNLSGWNTEQVERIRSKAKTLNAANSDQSTVSEF